MSNRRTVNRTERRQTNQEVYLVRRELENVPTIYTEDEVAAARAKAIESITDTWYKAFWHRLQKVETDSAHHCIDLYDLTERASELGKDVDGLVLEISALQDEHRNTNQLLNVLYLHAERTGQRAIQRDRRIDMLSHKVDSIAATLSRVGPHPVFHSDAAHGYCGLCGAHFYHSHSCTTSPAQGRSESTAATTDRPRGGQ